jgi:hypothetical protein
MKIMHATECAASGTLSVLIALSHELAVAGTRQLIVYSERAETPSNLTSLFPAGVEFVRVPAASGLHVRFAADFCRALASAVRTFKPDVLHLHSSKAGFLGRLAQFALRWPCRTFYSPHGLSFLDPYGDQVGERWRSFLSVVEAQASHAEAMVAGAVAGFRHAERRLCRAPVGG